MMAWLIISMAVVLVSAALPVIAEMVRLPEPEPECWRTRPIDIVCGFFQAVGMISTALAIAFTHHRGS